MAFAPTSSAFNEKELIPPQYTCDGVDISPHLRWEHAPENTVSFVLIMDDPDAVVGIWDHWVLYNIPPHINELAENTLHFPSGTEVGINSWNLRKYGGPCPPDQKIHRYFFKLYALNTTLSLTTPTKINIEVAMKNCVLGEAILMGRYDRLR